MSAEKKADPGAAVLAKIGAMKEPVRTKHWLNSRVWLTALPSIRPKRPCRGGRRKVNGSTSRFTTIGHSMTALRHYLFALKAMRRV